MVGNIPNSLRSVEIPTATEPSVTHLRACASARGEILRASKALLACMLPPKTAPGSCWFVLTRGQGCDAR